MAVISVEVPDKVAKKFAPYNIVKSTSLYNELDNNLWHTVHVWEKAEDVLDFLKNIK